MLATVQPTHEPANTLANLAKAIPNVPEGHVCDGGGARAPARTRHCQRVRPPRAHGRQLRRPLPVCGGGLHLGVVLIGIDFQRNFRLLRGKGVCVCASKTNTNTKPPARDVRHPQAHHPLPIGYSSPKWPPTHRRGVGAQVAVHGGTRHLQHHVTREHVREVDITADNTLRPGRGREGE